MDFKYLNLDIFDSSGYDTGNNTILVFKSKDDLILLVYSDQMNSLICYNLIDNKRIIQIEKAHTNIVTNFSHYLDKSNSRDLIITLCEYNLKVWNANNWECLLKLNVDYKTFKDHLHLSCFLNERNNIYIITINYLYDSHIKVFDLNGKEIKKFIGPKSKNTNNFIMTYYDKEYFSNYILVAMYNLVFAYDFNLNKIYREYKFDFLQKKKLTQSYKENKYTSLIIVNKEKYVHLIGANLNGFITIWNFHSSEILQNITIGNNIGIKCIGLWSDDCLYAGCTDSTIKFLNLKNKKVIKSLEGHSSEVITIKSVIHPKYGKCLISQGFRWQPIKLWIKKK